MDLTVRSIVLAWAIMPCAVGRNSSASAPPIAPAPRSIGVVIHAQVLLEGPYDAGGTGLMNDSLRTLTDFPLTEPYTALGFSNAGGGGGETTTPAVLAVSGPNAVVDWIRLELRSTTSPYTLLAATHALLQRDGDVVDAIDGVSPVALHLAPDPYMVAVRHRNHFGCMTASPVNLGLTPITLDFRSALTATWGTAARKSVGAFQVLWAGNTVYDSPIFNLLKYTNLDNDRSAILSAIGGVLPTQTLHAYTLADVNLDGWVKYTGTGNDRVYILQNIGGVVPTNTRAEQLP